MHPPSPPAARRSSLGISLCLHPDPHHSSCTPLPAFQTEQSQDASYRLLSQPLFPVESERERERERECVCVYWTLGFVAPLAFPNLPPGRSGLWPGLINSGACCVHSPKGQG